MKAYSESPETSETLLRISILTDKRAARHRSQSNSYRCDGAGFIAFDISVLCNTGTVLSDKKYSVFAPTPHIPKQNDFISYHRFGTVLTLRYTSLA
jgi:hypothetical protein